MLTPPGEVTPRNLDLQLLTGREYLTNLTADVASAQEGDRILIMSMSLEPAEPLVAGLMSALYGAAQRGAHVDLGVDAYGLLTHHSYGPLAVPWSTNRAAIDRLMSALNQLASFETANYGFINVPGPFSNKLAGRSHLKVSIVRNRVYLGSINLKYTHKLDTMLTIDDQPFADLLYGVCMSIIGYGNVKDALGQHDLRIPLDAHTGLIVDVGRKRQSAIFEEALSIIDEAGQWLAISLHFLPYDIVGDRLEAAIRRGVECDIYTNPVSYHGAGIISLAHRYLEFQQRRVRIPELFAGQLSPLLPGIHSKCANEKRGMVSTHNMASAGVKYGTAEMAIVRDTPEFGLSIRRHLQGMVAEATAQLTLGA